MINAASIVNEIVEHHPSAREDEPVRSVGDVFASTRLFFEDRIFLLQVVDLTGEEESL